MKNRTAAQKRLLAAAFLLLSLLLLLLLWLGTRPSRRIHAGILQTPQAYGAAMLLQTPAAQYACRLFPDAQALLRALNAGEIDAALLPFEQARAAEGCQIRAVLGYTTLFCFSDEALSGIADLNGRTLTLPEEMRASREERMLLSLLQAENVHCTLVYGDAGDIFLCGPDRLDGALRQGLDARFSLSSQWRQIKNNLPPAGLCLAARRDALDSPAYAAFEQALQNSVLFGREKTKKTVAMAAAAGLATHEQEAARLIDYCQFVFLTGANMSAALSALN